MHVDNGLGGGHLTLNSEQCIGQCGAGAAVSGHWSAGWDREGSRVDSLTVDSGLGIALHLCPPLQCGIEVLHFSRV